MKNKIYQITLKIWRNLKIYSSKNTGLKCNQLKKTKILKFKIPWINYKIKLINQKMKKENNLKKQWIKIKTYRMIMNILDSS